MRVGALSVSFAGNVAKTTEIVAGLSIQHIFSVRRYGKIGQRIFFEEIQ